MPKPSAERPRGKRRNRLLTAVFAGLALQGDRERGKVEPAALKEQPGLPAALFRAEEQERALGIIGRGGGNQARNGHVQIRRSTTATLSPRRSLSSADGRVLL